MRAEDVPPSDRPFGFGAADYRIIERARADDLVMTHISTNFDRTGFLNDPEVVFPIQRLTDAAADGLIGAPAQFHYSFMGATSPDQMRPAAEQLARAMHGEEAHIALLVPV